MMNPCINICYLTIRQQAQVVYEQIVNVRGICLIVFSINEIDSFL